MKTLDEYEQIAIDLFGESSHAVTWVRAQKKNKGTLDLSHASMMKMLSRMHEKTATAKTDCELPSSTSEVNPTTSMFAKLKKEQKT